MVSVGERKESMKIYSVLIIFLFSVLLTFTAAGSSLYAENIISGSDNGSTSNEIAVDDNSLKMLKIIVDRQEKIRQALSKERKNLKHAVADTDKTSVNARIQSLETELSDANFDFIQLATGIDPSSFGEKQEGKINWKEDLFSLIKPLFKELKQLTREVRQRSELVDELQKWKEHLPLVEAGVRSLAKLESEASDRELKQALKKELLAWQERCEQIRNQIEVTQTQLDHLKSARISIWASLQQSMGHFFRTRGLYVLTALFLALFIAMSGLLFQRFVLHKLPAYRKTHLSFAMRLLEMLYAIFVVTCTFASIFVVFYLTQDWMLMSLAIIFFLGILWTMRFAIPKFWKQSILMLNLGTMREGERIVLHGVPWSVKKINLFTEVENPSLGITLKLPIADLTETISRPSMGGEPWFPCRKNDWVILSDGIRGKVVSLTHEMVEMVQRGGAHKVYQTGDFISLAPMNLSRGFRVKVPFGVSYNLQNRVTADIPTLLTEYLGHKIEEAGYGGNLRMVRVDFGSAGASSLDLLVLADFDGEMAPLYNRVQRQIQEWCVDACSENGWEIPFPQLTVHKA